MKCLTRQLRHAVRATLVALAVGMPFRGIAAGTGKGPVYRNPVLDAPGAADPHVIRVGDTYHLYPTLSGRDYPVFTSTNLVDWERKPPCFTDPRGGLWAPDVFHNASGDGKFYLYYTVNRERGSGLSAKAIGVAVADHPLGPFQGAKDLVSPAIDAHVFRDTDGRLFLYYVDLARGFRIMAQPLADPVTRRGDAVEVIRPTEPWEKAHGHVTEGPFMIKRGAVYYLMYSGSGADGPDYAIGYATASSPTGPFNKHPGSPIAKRGDGILGPGHHCVVAGPRGRGLWMVYHQKEDDRVNWKRFVAIDPIWFDEAGVLRTRLSRGTAQPAP
jgi:beta-xylosidase